MKQLKNKIVKDVHAEKSKNECLQHIQSIDIVTQIYDQVIDPKVGHQIKMVELDK